MPRSAKRWEAAVSDIPMPADLSPEERASVKRTVLALADGAPAEVKPASCRRPSCYRSADEGPLDEDAQRKAEGGQAPLTPSGSRRTATWVTTTSELLARS